MLALERFTTEYDPVEDRIRVVGIGAGAEQVTLWLNQRLVRLLLPSLSKWVASRIGIEQGGALPEVQEFHQAAAIVSHNADEPPVIPAGTGILVVSVDFTELDVFLRLAFKDRNTNPLAMINFSELALRQWLEIVRRVHEAAGWPTDKFPDWLLVSKPTQLN